LPTGSHLDHGDSQWQEILLDLNQSELHKNRHLVLQVRKGIPTKIRVRFFLIFGIGLWPFQVSDYRRAEETIDLII
jgi:hypothetical protein